MTTTCSSGSSSPGSTKHPESVADWKREVGQDDRRPRPPQVLSRRRLVAGFDHDMPLRLEHVAEHASQRILVFDEKDRKGHV